MILSNSDPTLSLAPTTRNPPVHPHPGPRFADFQFRTIGQQPELLKRISAPNPDMQYDHDSGIVSSSFSSSDQSIQTFTPPESDSAKRPSLRDRLSLLQPPSIGRDEDSEDPDVTMANPLEAFDSRSAQSLDISLMVKSSDSFTPQNLPAVLKTPILTLDKEPDLSQNMVSRPPSVESHSPMITSSETETQISPLIVHSTQSSASSGVSTPFSSGEAVHSLMALRTLHSRLSSSLSHFNPISTANALATAQTAKDKCTEILAAAHRAHALAQQASLLAQDSLVAAQECLDVAATVQNRADLALSAVENIHSGQGIGGGEWEYNATVEALKDDLHQLAEWVSRRDAYESKHLSQVEKREIEKRKKKLALELDHQLNTFPANKQPLDLITHGGFPGIKINIRETNVTTVEDEADAATRAWNQHREQSAERKRLAEDEMRKRREVEAELERQKIQAQCEADAREAELERLRAERLKAEEEEKSRQEKETLELQRQQQELEIAQFLRGQKQSQNNMVKVAAEEKKKAQAAEAEKEARLIAEHEQKRGEIHEKELLKRHHDAQKGKPREMVQNEAKGREVILERMNRLTGEAHQPLGSADTVTNILDKAKEKQYMETLIIPPSRHTPLPSPPTHKTPVSTHAKFGNNDSKRTLLTNSPQTVMQLNRTFSGSNILHESINSVNPTSSISNSSMPIQEDAKSHEVTPSILSSIDKRLQDESSHTREADRKSGDGVRNMGSSSSSPLTPLSEMDRSLSVSLPPHSPVTTTNDPENMHSEVYSNGPENVSVLPPSRVLPVSPDAQRANLQPFMDAIKFGPRASDTDERKSFCRIAPQPTATNERPPRKPLSSSQINVDPTCGTTNPESIKKLKWESDEPVLSMPSCPPAVVEAAPAAKPKLPAFKQIKAVPSAVAPETSSSPKELPPSTQIIPPSQLFAQPPEPSVVSKSKEKGRPAAVRRNVPPLSCEQSQAPVDTLNQTYQANGLHPPLSPPMGPDAALTDSWAQMGDNPMMNRQRKQLPRNRDRSPVHSVPSANRLPPKRPRGFPRVANDHYSPPRRIPDPLSSHNDYRRGSGSTEYTQGLSPPTKYIEDGKSLSSDDMPIVGRKRYRDDTTVDAPAPRRHRYDSPPLHHDDHVPPSPYQPLEADWSRLANYSRSPSPHSRTTPLALRLESEKPWNSQGGSSYRPNYNDSNVYAHDSQSRHTKNPRYAAPNFQSIPQGPSYYDASAQSNQQRQFGRNDMTTDTRLPLLSRFTDSTQPSLPPFNNHPLPPFHNHHGPTRPRMPRGRGGGNQALEQRISKPKSVSLINRLEDAN